jgi:hypothetical protein
MLLVGGVATKDMEENHVYAGSPAKDVTNKTGPQFASVTYGKKLQEFNNIYQEFLRISSLIEKDFRAIITDDLTDKQSNENETFFNLAERTYSPSRSENEYRFFQYLLYDRAKFVPRA